MQQVRQLVDRVTSEEYIAPYLICIRSLWIILMYSVPLRKSCSVTFVTKGTPSILNTVLGNL